MKIRLSLLALALCCCLPAPARAQVACMVSGLEGQAVLTRRGKQQAGIGAFKKLLPGDEVELSQGASLRLSYLALGKAESWTGPARITIEAQGGEDGLNHQKPRVANLGTDTALLEDSPMLDSQRELVAGQLAVRGARNVTPENLPLEASQREQLRKAQAEYRRLKDTMPAGDATPYLFYLTALDRLGQRASMAELIQELLDKDGGNPELARMLKGLYVSVQ